MIVAKLFLRLRRSWAAAIGCVLLTALAAAEPALPDDPIPIRRVQINARQFLTELERRQELQAVPRLEFEEQLRRARRALKAAQNPPVLQEAHYRAGWLDGHLVGSAAFKIAQLHAGPGLFALEPWNLAVRGQASLDREPAILGEFAGKPLALLIGKAGQHELALSWSARGDRRPEGWWFFIQTPAAPVAMLELELPENYLLECPGSKRLVLTAQAAAAGVRRWQIAFGGASPQELELLVRQPHQGDSPLVVLRHLAEHDFALDGVESRFDLDLEIPRGKVGEITLDADGRLEPTAAFLRHAVSKPLTFEVRSAEHGRKRIHLRLPEGVERRLAIEFRARIAVDGSIGQATSWIAPSMRVLDSFGGAVTMRVRAPPEVVLSDWDFGDFKPDGPLTQEKRGTTVVESLTLVQRGLITELGPQPPRARLRWHAADFTVRQEAWWHVASDASALVVRSTFQIQSGTVSQLTVQLPSGWQLEDLELSPGSLLASRTFDEQTPGRPLVIHLKEPADTSTALRLTTRLRPVDRLLNLQGRTELPIPRVTPSGARWVETTLAVSLEHGRELRQPLFRAELRGAAVTASPAPAANPLWTGLLQAPEFVATFHEQEARARLVVEPLSPEIALEPVSEITLGSTERRAAFRAAVRPVQGAAAMVTLHMLDAPPELRWEVSAGSCRIREQNRISEGTSARFEILLDRPMVGVVVLKASAALPSGDVLVIPVLRGQPDRPATPRLVVRVQSGLAIDLKGASLQPVASSVEPGDPPVWRTFTFGPALTSVSCHVQSCESGARPAPIIESETLLVQANPAGRHLIQYRCLINNPRGSPVSIQLPADTSLHSVHVDGRPLTVSQGASRLSLPASPGRVRYDIEYIHEVPEWTCGARLRAAAPTWETGLVVLQSRRFWAIPTDFTPLIPDGLAEFAGPASMSKRLEGFSRLDSLEALWSAASGQETAWAGEVRHRFQAAWDSLPAQERIGSLAQVLWRVQQRGRDPRVPFVVDRLAVGGRVIDPAPDLHPQGLPISSTWGPPDSELVFMPCRSATLVTTRRRLAADRVSGPAEAQLHYGAVIPAALHHGHDPTGRFVAVSARSSHTDLGLPSDPGVGWTVWEETAPARDGAELVCVREDTPWMAGLALGLFGLAAGTWLSRSGRGGVTFRIAILLAGLLALIWLPLTLRPIGWCLLATAAGLAIHARQVRPARPEPSPRRGESTVLRRAVVSAAGLALVVMFLSAGGARGRADPSDPVTVYVLAEEGGQPVKETILISRAEWTRITDAARGSPGSSSYAVLGAEYDVEVHNEEATIKGDFDIHVFNADPVDVVLPVRHARLIRSQADQADSLAAALPRDAGFALRVVGRGRHTLQLTWISAVTALGSERTLRCGIPQVSASRLNMRWRGRPQAAQVMGSRGGHWQHANGESARLQADLGRTAELNVRWWTPSEVAPQVRARAYHLWDLNPARPALQTAIDYEVSGGALSRLQLEVPWGLDLKSVEVLPRSPLALAPRLRDWRLDAAGARILTLEFVHAQTGLFRVQLEFRVRPGFATSWVELLSLEPLLGWTGQPVPRIVTGLSAWNDRIASASASRLRLTPPIPLDVLGIEGFVAVRLEELRAEQLAPGPGVSMLRPGEWPELWPRTLASANEAQHVFRFEDTASASLQLRLQPASPTLQSKQSLSLTLNPAECDLRARLELTVDDGAVEFLNCQLPPDLTLKSVQGPDVQRWTQHGTRLQVWLRRSVGDETTISLRGWLKPVRSENEATQLRVPRLRLHGGTGGPTRLEVRLQGVRDLHLESLTGLRELTGPFAEDSIAGSWLAAGADYDGVLKYRAQPVSRADADPPTARPLAAPAAPASPLRVLAADYETVLAGSSQAVTTATWYVWHGPADELRLRFAGEQKVLEATIDGRPAVWSKRDEEAALAVNLPPTTGWSTVTLSWIQEGMDEEDRVHLPYIDGVADFPATISLRPGAGAQRLPPTLHGGADAAAEVELRRAEAAARFIEALVKSRPPRERSDADALLLRSLQEFYVLFHSAAARAQGARADFNPRVLALRRELERQAAGSAWEAIRQRAEETVRLGTLEATDPGPRLAEVGTPSYGAAAQGLTELVMETRPAEYWPAPIAFLKSLGALAVVGTWFVAGRWRRARKLRATSWPEMLILAGTLWCLFMPGWLLGLVAAATGLAARTAQLSWLAAKSVLGGNVAKSPAGSPVS